MYMLSRIDCIYLKAHAVANGWNKFTATDQKLLKKQFARIAKKEKADKLAAFKGKRKAEKDTAKHLSATRKMSRNGLRDKKRKKSNWHRLRQTNWTLHYLYHVQISHH